ncbi:hypothetical protein ACVWYN_002035 [Pedobacter sp. UYP24]
MLKQFFTFFLAMGFATYSSAQSANSALITVDTGIVKSHTKINFKPFIVPGVFVGYGLLSLTGDNVLRRLDYSTHAELQEDHPNFTSKIDNYTPFIPVVAVYGLDLLGVKAKNNIVDRTAMLASSFLVASAGAGSLKIITNRLRPNGADRQSFPSGHTTLVFMTAEFLNQEYKDRSIWFSVAGYAIATGTGILRLYNNEHWVSDVVAGAGVGIISTKLTYLVYPYLKRKLFHGKTSSVMINPAYQQGNMTLSFSSRF